MSIRPIDLQVLIPRVADVGKVQQNADHQTMLQQQQVGDQWQKINDDRHNQVQTTPKTEGGKVHGEKPNDGNPNKRRKLAKEPVITENNINDTEFEGNNPSDRDPVRGHTVDIKT